MHPTQTRRALEDQIVAFSHRLHTAGWVANHDGNITVRLASDRFLATPTGVSKAAVCRDQFIVVDGAGKVVSGSSKPFSEIELHLYVYRHRSDVRSVMHAHPPTATGAVQLDSGVVRGRQRAEAHAERRQRYHECAHQP